MLYKRYLEDPAFHMQPKYMSDSALSELYSARPVISSDIILYQKPSSVFLTIRHFLPGEGLWVIGGARLAGETAMETVVRKLKAEGGLEIDHTRLESLGIVEYIWPHRYQEPTHEGRHDVNYMFSLEISDKELETVNASLDPEEFDAQAGLQRFESLDALVAAGARECIQDYYQALFPAKP